MSPAEVYVKAAELVATGAHTYPCTAVYSVEGVSWNEPQSLTRKFILTMAPGRAGFNSPYAASAFYLLKLLTGLRDHSVLALCFMAAMETD